MPRKLTLHAMVSLAGARGGQCLSTLYVNSTIPLLWRCSVGHLWNAVPGSIRKGSWCPDCARVRRLTLEQMQQLAESRGGRCLSESYRNTATKLEWRCSNGHEWTATPLQIKKGHWCPFCARVVRLTLDELPRIAVRKGGKCLSQEYLGSSKPLRWKCAVGHEWTVRPSSVKAGSWCPACAHNQKLKLEELQEIAKDRGGECLSTIYRNGRTALLWVCGEGHCWKARPANVKGGTRRKGTWCKECYNARRRFHAKHRIETMRDLAIARGGSCLSREYVSSKSKLIWQCKAGHRWRALPTSVLQGTWCPVCARNRPLGLPLLQEIAATRGGACLSREYVNERTALWWGCANGHRWKTTPNKVKRGTWCPKCASIRRRSKWTRKDADRRIELTRTAMRPRPRRNRGHVRRPRARAKLLT
jgi:hypothetical protein